VGQEGAMDPQVMAEIVRSLIHMSRVLRIDNEETEKIANEIIDRLSPEEIKFMASVANNIANILNLEAMNLRIKNHGNS
jgi:hypothetical protein